MVTKDYQLQPVKPVLMAPRNGLSAQAGRYPNAGVQSFTSPRGWEDALLVLEAAD